MTSDPQVMEWPAPPGLGRAFAEYSRGRLRLAIDRADEAAARARIHGQPNAEATALITSGQFRLWAGEFDAAARSLDMAECVVGELPDSFDWSQSSLCSAFRAVSWTLRGELAKADNEFARALAAAQRADQPEHEGLVRALRAAFTANNDPVRALQDSRLAWAFLYPNGNPWWKAWAIHAVAIAALAAGMQSAAETTLRQALTESQPSLVRARTLLLLGQTLLYGNRRAEARGFLKNAVELFEMSGARYWTVRGYTLLARSEPASAAAWIQRARRAWGNDTAFVWLLQQDSALRLEAFGPGRVFSEGRPLTFASSHPEKLLFLLAFAGEDGLHVDQLAERLWNDAARVRRQMLGRIRTMLWDARRGLGVHAWRLERTGPVIRMNMTGVAFDLTEARAVARSNRDSHEVEQLLRPILSRWAYEEWVVEQSDTNQALHAQLSMC